MRWEILLFFITGLVMANIYTEGKYFQMALGWTKYYKMIGVAFVAISIYWLLHRNPHHAQKLMEASNEYMKYLPVDKNSMISPILDFSGKQSYESNDTRFPVLPMHKVNNRGGNGTTTKRSVSETKKKFVAAKQNWTCLQCKKQLPAWFEVHHVTPLESGGSNDVSNLVALCRNCHGEQTALANL